VRSFRHEKMWHNSNIWEQQQEIRTAFTKILRAD